MISYDRYKDKIAKLAAVKNFVVRFRALFIAAFALIIALVAAFLATKGIITSDISLLQADILYGDVYDLKPAKALFSSVRYEYSPEDSEDWNAEKPDKAGKYRVRTVTSRAFGVGYGKPLSFEIAPRPTEIAIAQNSVVYGDDPNNFTCTLVNGDKLSVVGFRFDSFATDITSVCANADSVVITNAAGEDVTYCYALATPAKEVQLLAKQVSFAPKAAEYIYNGTPFAYESLLDEASQKQLAAGDIITVTSQIVAPNGETVASPKNAGEYTVKITDIKIMNGDTDVTALYDWESGLKTAKISVARRAITVQTASDSKEYDATPLVNANFTAENLADGHTFIVEQSASRKVVGSSFNEITAFKIEAGEGEEVTDNYAVTIAAGTLEITPREITIKTASAERAYNGKPLSNEHFTMNPSPIDGHTFAVSRDLPEITEVGKILNELSVSATDEEGNPVTENYAVGYAYGDLEITEQELKYTAETITRVYDGTALISAGTVTGGLAEGERVEIDIDASAKQTLAGDTDNAPVFRVYRIEDGKETTRNYVPTLQGERGKLVVQKRRVTVHTLTPDEAFEYDGGDHVWPLADVFLEGTEEYGLADGQVYMAVIGADAQIRNVGTQENKFSVEFYDDTYENEVTDNYDVIKYEYGSLTVYRRMLAITTGTKTDVEYDGTPFSYTEGWSAPNLALGHTLEADTTQPIASVSEVLAEPLKNEVTYLVFDEEGYDVTDNYDIQDYTYGVINRTPRAVTLTTESASTPYDGNPMQCLKWKDVERLLTEYKHQIALDETQKDSFASITYGYDEVGNQLSQWNILYFVVLDGEGKDISYNYELTVEYGSLTREKCAMTVHTLSATKVYDGKILNGDDEGEFMTAKPKFDGLVEGELYETKIRTHVLNVKYEERAAVAVKNDTVYDFYTSDKSFKTTHNYEVTTEMGDLLVTPRPLDIRTSTVTREYDGQWLNGIEEGEGELGATLITGFADGQSAAVIESTIAKIRDVLWTEKDGKQEIDGIDNTTQYKVIITETSEDTTDNYYIASRVNGKLTVTPKALTVTTLSAEKVYDAESLDGSEEGEWENGKPVFNGLIAGETYEAYVIFYMLNVKRAENGVDVLTSDNETEYRFYAQEDGAERETTDNYTIEYVYGTLKILPREITVTTAGGSRPYDGTPLTKREAGDYTADNLVITDKHTHTLALDNSKASEFGTVTDVLDSPQKNVLFVLIKEGEKDVTSNYNIDYEYGDLIITPRDITVTTADATKVYDGTPLVKEDGKKLSWLFTGHELALDESRRSEFGSVVNVAEGEVDNVLYFKVQLIGGTEEQNARVNANYNILPPETWGKLKVTPKTITVTTETKHWTYDGEEHEWHEKSCAEQDFLDSVIGDTKGKHVLVEDATKQSAFGKITNVWENEAKNNVQYYVVYPEGHEGNSAEDNAFINQNYKIEYVYGDLVIDERPVTITAITAQKKYDGVELRGDGKNYNANVTVITDLTITGDGLADGETAKAIDDSTTTIVDVGKVSNETLYNIYKGDTLTTLNYKLTIVHGELEVTKREITLTTLTAEKIYDGTPLDGDKGYGSNKAPTIGGDGLANTDKREVVKSTGIVTVQWKDDIVGGEITTYKNTTTYRIVNRNGEDVTERNYTIELEYGTLKILPREIKYTTPTATHEYDGEEFYALASGYTVDFVNGATTEAGKGLVLDHKLVPVTDMANPYSTITNVLIEDGKVASIDNEVYYRVVDGNGDDITANYIISDDRTWGTLTVTPRRLQITTNNHTWVYADTDYEDVGYTAKHFVKDSTTATDSAFTLVSGHTLETDTKTTVKTVCTNTPNACTYTVTDGTNDVSDNYELTIVAGKLTVSKRPITVTSGSQTWVYDGQAHNKLDGFTWTDLGTGVGLLSDHDHTVLVDTATADAPTITHFSENEDENNILTFKIEKNGTDVTANYGVRMEYGTIAIEKAEITVVLTPFEPVKYSGDAIAYATGKNNYETASSTALQNGEELEVAVYFTKDAAGKGDKVTPILAGTYYAHLDYDNCKVFSGSTETDATDYEITAESVELKITATKITVTTETDSREYNAEPYTLPEFTDETVEALEKIGHTIEVDESKSIASVTDVTEGEVDNIFSYIIYDGDGNDVTNNFDVTEVWGKISVTQRTVTVVTASGTHEYDGESFSHPHWEENPDGLLAGKGHKLEWDESKTTASVLSVYDGEITNTFSVVVKNASDEDISYNYDIQYQTDGKIKITPRQIEITVNSAEKTYDGTKLVDKGATAVHLTNGVADSKTALLDGDKLVADSESPEVSITNAYDIGTGINLYTYIVKHGENEVTDNYQIVKTNAGDLNIKKLEVEVTLTKLDDTVYGDTVSVYPTGTGNYAAPTTWNPATEQLEVAVYFTLNGEETALGQAGTYNVVLDTDNSKIYKDGSVTQRGIENYSLTQKTATVTIAKRQVELTIRQLPTASKEYDGEKVDYTTAFGSSEVCYTAKTLNAKQGVFASGEALEIELTILGAYGHTSLRHADSYTVSIDLDNCTVVKVGDGTEIVTDNYTLTVTSDTASYTVNKRELTITLVDDSREYDGTEYVYSFKAPDQTGYEIDRLLDDTTLSGNFVFTGDELPPMNAGTYTVAFQTDDGTWAISSSRTEPCETSDYTIKTVNDATITITKRKITVAIESWGDQYKAEDFSFTDRHYTSAHVGEEGDGFVNSDDENAYTYEFKQGGESVMPRNVGVYNVTVSFSGLSANYDITKNDGGTFTVNKREITVVGQHDDITYAADKLDDNFSFTSYKTGESETVGFLGTDASAFTATYTVTYNDSTFAHTTAVIHGGKYGVMASLSVKPEQSEIEGNYQFTYEAGEFTVKPREISATRDEAFTKVYDKVAISTTGWKFFDWYEEKGETANGFLLDSERANAKPTFEIYGDGEEPLSPINAGTYSIRIREFTSADNSGLIERDYIVTGGQETLTIEKFLLVIKPKDYTGLNTGEDIALPEDSVITYTANEAGNGLVTCSLPTGDSITVEGDAVLKPGSKYVQAVYIDSYEMHGGDGVENNYRVIYKYDTKDAEDAELLKKLGAGMKVFFRGNITCDTRTVEIKQILLNDKHKTVITDGSKYTIPLNDVDFELVTYANRSPSVTVAENKYGLLDGHFAKVTAASVRQYPGIYKEWLTVKIYRMEDGKEVDVSKGYNILYKDDESSYITVKEISLAFDIMADMGALVNSKGETLQNGDVVYLAGEPGKTVALELNKDFKLTEGSLFGKHLVEFKAVVEGGALVGLKPSMYTEHSSGAHISQETYYDVDSAVLRYSIYLTADSAEKPFDGTALTCKTATASWLPAGYTFTVTINTAQTIAGTTDNTITTGSAKIFDENGKEASVVAINLSRGKLTVTKRKLYVKSTPEKIFTYNGTAQSYTTGYVVDGLVDGHVITSVKGTELTLPTASGVKNEITFLEIKPGPASRTNYLSSYEIIYDANTQYGYLNVLRRDVNVSIVGNTFTKEYDGTPLTLDISVASGTDEGVLTALGHKLEWSAVSITRPSENTVVSFGRGMLHISGTDGDVTSYYNIIVAGGITDVQLTVTPRALTLTSNNLTKTYDGIPLIGTASLTDGTLASGDRLTTVTGSASQKDAGSITYQLGCTIVGSDGSDITEDCYEVSYVSGTLQVNAKVITVTSANLGTFVYGQTPVAPTGAGNYGGLSASLASGETLEVSYFFTTDRAGNDVVSPKNVGTYFVQIASYTVNGGSADNYEFECTPSTFTIGKKALEIKLRQGLTKPYDGDAYLYEFVIFENSLLSYTGEEFHATVLFNGAAQAIDADSYTITLGTWSVSNEDGNISGNYDVRVTAGSLVIEQRVITVDLGDITKAYDGETFEYTDAWSADNLLAGVTLNADVVCTQNGLTVDAIEAGEYGFALANIVVSDDSLGNYQINVSGSLTITA